MAGSLAPVTLSSGPKSFKTPQLFWRVAFSALALAMLIVAWGFLGGVAQATKDAETVQEPTTNEAEHDLSLGFDLYLEEKKGFVEFIIKPSDPDQIKRLGLVDNVKLEPGQGLFDITKAPEGSWLRFDRAKGFVIVIPLTADEFLRWFEKEGGLTVSWRKQIKPTIYDQDISFRSFSVLESILNSKQRVSFGQSTHVPKQWLITETVIDSHGHYVTAFEPAEPGGVFRGLRGGDNLRLAFIFNRQMAEPGKGKLNQDLWPVQIEPDLGFSGQWVNEWTFELTSSNLSDEDFQREVIGAWFKVSVKDNLVSKEGQSIGGLMTLVEENGRYRDGKVMFETFRSLSLEQSGFDELGQPIIDLSFNKAVTLADLNQSASWSLIDGSQENRTAIVRPEFMSFGGPNNTQPSGQTARFKTKLKNGDRLTVHLDNFKSADGQSELSDQYQDLMIFNNFEVTSTYVEIESDYPYRAYMDIGLDSKLSNQPLEKFIRLSPPSDFTVLRNYNSFRVLAPFTRDRDLQVTLLKGLQNENGALSEDLTLTGRLDDKRIPRISFTGEGKYLSPKLPKLVRIGLSDCDRVVLNAWKVPPEILPTLINIHLGLDNTFDPKIAFQFSDSIFKAEIPIEAAGGVSLERLLDLNDVFGEAGPGTYILRATPVYLDSQGYQRTSDGSVFDDSLPGYDYFWHNSNNYLPITVTDLGLAARVIGDEITVWVTTLSSVLPVEGTKVKFLDLANRVVTEGVTDKNGFLTVKPVKGAAGISFLTAEKDSDYSYLPLKGTDQTANPKDPYVKWFGGGGAYLTPGQDAQTRYLDTGYEAFMFMPRNIYKPGENIQVKALVRDRRMLPPTEAFPLLWRLFDPDSRVVAQGTASVNLNGGLNFEATIPFSGRTGLWKAELRIPESEGPIGNVFITVDDFVPPRLDLSLAANSKISVGTGSETGLRGRADYLFGAPGANLQWELKAEASPIATVTSHDFKDYDFTGLSSPNAPRSWLLSESSGQLDAQGVLDFALPLHGQYLPQALVVNVIWQVMEDSGRWNGTLTDFLWFPRPYILGLNLADHLVFGQTTKLKLAALKVVPSEPAKAKTGLLGEVTVPEPKFDLVDGAIVKASILRVTETEYRVIRYGREYLESTEELSEVFTGTTQVVKGLGSIDFTPKESGLYEINLSGPDGSSFRSRFEVLGLSPAPQEAQMAAPKLKVELDRAVYAPGEQATARITASFDGPVWVSLETDRVHYSDLAQLVNGTCDVTVTVPPEAIQNAHLTAAAIRPLDKLPGERLVLGEAMIKSDLGLNSLSVEVISSERLTPSSSETITVRLTDSKGAPLAGEVTVTLVDEGLLSLTSYEITNPLDFFGRTRKAVSRLFRMHHLFLKPEDPVLPFLIPGGSDEARNDNLFSPFSRETEPLSLMVATVWVGANGVAEIDLDIPEYSGRARLTAVAGSLNRFGISSQSLLVNRDLTVEPSIPLALAPDDTFVANVRIFSSASAESILEPSITITGEGPLSILAAQDENGSLDPNNYRPKLSAGESRTVRLEMKAAPSAPVTAETAAAGGALEGTSASRVGQAALAVTVEQLGSKQTSFTQKATTVVRPPYARVTDSTGGQLTDNRQELSFATGWYLPGTEKGFFSLSAGPAAEIGRAASYLAEYPYGCLEQTISKAWVQLAALDLGDFLSALDPVTPEMALKGALGRLATMQTFKGGFAAWPRESRVYQWGSVYAAHFLTEAAGRMELPEGLHRDSLNYVRQLVQSRSNSNPADVYWQSTKAYGLFVLALNGEFESGWINSLRDRPQYLTSSAKIFLAGAEALRDGEPRTLLKLEQATEAKAVGADHDLAMESPTRDLALKLMAWTAVDPLNSVAAQLAELLATDGREGRWRNTQENAVAVLALSSYLTKSATGLPYQAEVFTESGEMLAEGTHQIPLSLGDGVLGGRLQQPLTVNLSGDGRPWYNLTVTGVPLSAPEPVSQGLVLSRRWEIVGPDGTSWIDPAEADDQSAAGDSTDYPLISVERGSKIKIEITVKTEKPVENVVVADLLPGGFEIVSFSESAVQKDSEYNDDDDEYYNYNDEGDYYRDSSVRLETREDRVIAVINYLAHSTVLTYEVRAVTPGRFVIPPTTAEGMYDPEKRAVLTVGNLEVREK
jgi:uncharacterized protein YfaS (alpha-2-macroglobulin family)